MVLHNSILSAKVNLITYYDDSPPKKLLSLEFMHKIT